LIKRGGREMRSLRRQAARAKDLVDSRTFFVDLTVREQ